jgi:transcriptional regulator with XRE-family HTH domain
MTRYHTHNVGAFIKEKMESAGLNQTRLAKKVGVSHQAVGGWLNGEIKNIRADHVQKLAEIFRVTSDELLFGVSAQAPAGVKDAGAALYYTGESGELFEKFNKLLPHQRRQILAIMDVFIHEKGTL